ncbi:Cof-type HAD-IIB family hydrolase [Lacticaseibacillus baoqingensis]|uniref:Cof-type HAD-IIB family hydrolase n=1 Tax=Lacticaseibacillus baoqingensis TaxID=2486013 RepID=A0ABW4E6B5_9LACO|nr:Cof-type HAD-IIB family hydrolase [Lacticaseibacillus baoqingensis]
MTYKMIVSDLDESLLRTDGSISPADIKTIKQLQAQGVKFVPNTGRGFASVQGLLQSIGTYQTADQYVISYNGGAIVENAHDRIIAAHPLPFAVAEAIFRLGVAHPELGCHIYTLHTVYVFRPTADELAYLHSRGVAYRDWQAHDLSALAAHAIVKVIFDHPDLAIRQAFAREVAAKVAYPCTVSYSSGRYVEFNPAGIDKGDAAIALGAHLGIKPAEIIGLGDNLNDLKMLQKVGLGVSVANGIPAIQQAADLVLAVDNDHDPITALSAAVFAPFEHAKK